MANPLDRLKDLHRKVFVKGQETVAKEVAALEYAEQQVYAKQVLEAAAETIVLANRLAAEMPELTQLAADIEKAVREGATEAITGRHQVAERGEAQGAIPFSESSASSAPSLPKSRGRKALPQPPQPTQKRKPGRPRKQP
jgi:hypothetical protein